MAQCAVSPGPKGRADCGANGLRRTAQGGVMTAMGFFHSARGPARLDRPASRTRANASMIPTPWRSSSSASGVAAGFGVLFANLAAGGTADRFRAHGDMGQGHGLDATATATRGQAWKRQPGFKGAQRHPQAQKTAPGMTKGGDASAGPRGSGGLQDGPASYRPRGRPAAVSGNSGPRRTARCATTRQRPVS